MVNAKPKRKAARKSAPNVVEELRVRRLVLVDGTGRECGWLDHKGGSPQFVLAGVDGGEVVQLYSNETTGAGLMIGDEADECGVQASLQSYPDKDGPAGLLELANHKGDVTNAAYGQLKALNRVADGMAMDDDPPALRQAVATLRRVYRSSTRDEWQKVAMVLLAGYKAADAGKAVQS